MGTNEAEEPDISGLQRQNPSTVYPISIRAEVPEGST